jgi:hypothetical protein
MNRIESHGPQASAISRRVLCDNGVAKTSDHFETTLQMMKEITNEQ